MKRIFGSLLAFATLLGVMTLGSAAAPVSSDDYVPGELIVGLTPGANGGAIAAALSAEVDRVLLGGEAVVLTVGGNPVSAARIAANVPGVRYAEPNWIRSLHGHGTATPPDDPDFGLKWDLYNDASLSDGGDTPTHGADINWLSAYDALQSVTLVETVVAILDTGVDAGHPDLNDKLVPGFDFIDNDNDPQDGFGHGTHVGGIAAAETNNGTGTTGVAFSSLVKIMPIKVCSDSGSCPSDAIANGIRYAADNGAKVVNLSLGGSSISQAEVDAINYADGKGVLIVASAGNDNKTAKSYPAAQEPVMAIAATDWDDGKASYSNYGADWVDLAAPGGDMDKYDDPEGVYSTMPTYNVYMTSCRARGLLSPCYDQNYDQVAGTSMAAPQVAGAAGLLFALNAGSNTQVRDLIQQNANPITGTGTLWANGRLDIGAAVAAAGTEPTYGSISGTVKDDSGNAIGGATVETDTGQSATTGTNGTYTLTDVPTGDRTVTASADGHEAASQTVTVSVGSTTVADFTLDRLGTLTGTVSDGTNAIGGATVTASNPAATYSTTTAADGTYSLAVPDGTYDVAASATGYDPSTQTGIVVDKGATATVNFTLTASATSSTVSVDSVSYSTSGGRLNDKHLNVTMALVDDLDAAVSGASVSIELYRDGTAIAGGTGTTGTDGTVTFTLNNAASGCYSTVVTQVTAEGLTWDEITPANEFCKT